MSGGGQMTGASGPGLANISGTTGNGTPISMQSPNYSMLSQLQSILAAMQPQQTQSGNKSTQNGLLNVLSGTGKTGGLLNLLGML